MLRKQCPGVNQTNRCHSRPSRSETMDERAAESDLNEVYEDARGELPVDDQSNDEFEDVQSDRPLSEQFDEQTIGDGKSEIRSSRSSDKQDADQSSRKNRSVEESDGEQDRKPDEEQDGESDRESDEKSSNTEQDNEKQKEPSEATTQTTEQPDSDLQYSEEELNEKLLRSTELKEAGNVHFKSQEYEKSLELYSKALAECPNRFGDKKAIILNNKAVCRWKLLERSSEQLNFGDAPVKTEFDEIIADLSRAIELNPGYFKPYLKRAEFNQRFGGDKLDNALEDYQKVLEMTPQGKLRDEIKYEIVKLQKQIEERNEKLKQEMFAQLKNLGNLCLRPFGLSTDNFKLQQNENGGYSVNFQQ